MLPCHPQREAKWLPTLSNSLVNGNKTQAKPFKTPFLNNITHEYDLVKYKFVFAYLRFYISIYSNSLLRREPEIRGGKSKFAMICTS
jgi:hypothetical protein